MRTTVSGAIRIAAVGGVVAAVAILTAAHASAAEQGGAAGRPASILYAEDYGESLASPAGSVRLWWCDATRKVSRRRAVPAATGAALRMAAARNDFEAVQLVVRPEEALRGLTVRAGDLRGADGAAIPADAIRVLRVRYVTVRIPTDKTGVADDWPDPLPPFERPIDVPAGVNQPIWILVHVPEAAKAGDYEAMIRLEAQGWSAAVPLRLHVWGFTLPKTPFTESAFGMSMGTAYRYHGVTEEKDKRDLFEKYMQSFADHRISPYNPTPLDPIEYKFPRQGDGVRAEVRFDRFDRAMQEAVDRWHITSFNVHLPGMGGGTFDSRHEGEIAGHRAGTPEYEALFASVGRQLVSHLREKGWLDKAYVYWFDEPEPKDYDFVRQGMARLKKHAPGLRRMLTEEPHEALFGAVDLWCPVTPSYNHEIAEKRRALGEQFWWYVCCGPKEPFCTLFIDHPATELRVWLWQTWQRKIRGILIWETLWWTSSTAFPDSLQDPYKDPMSYQTGYGAKPGEKKYWGNGDGRFLYPPEANVVSGGKTPVLEGPVSSLRWEMLREGVEDVDYLHLLADAIRVNRVRADAETLRRASALLDVPPTITRSMTEFTSDPTPIYERRAAVAEMIERLSAAPRR